MAEVSRAEKVVLTLEQQIDSAANAATGALGRLENQIAREQNALGRLETSLASARVKLDLLAAGSVNPKSVQAFERQAAAVAELDAKANSARQRLAQMEGAGGDPKAIKSLSKELARVDEKLVSARTKLEGLREASQSKSVDVAAFKKAELAVAQLSDKVGAQRDKIGALQEKHTNAQKTSAQLGDAMRMVGAETGLTSNKFLRLGSSLAALGPYGAVAAAAVLLVAAAVTAVVGVIVKGISAAGQMRSEFLRLQAASVSNTMGFHWLLNATRESTLAALQMEKAISRVAGGTSLSRAKLADYAVQLRQARFSGKDLETTLRAMAIAGSAGNDQMAKDVLMMARMYRYAGKSVDDLYERIEKKLGRAAAEKAIALDVQMQRLGENIQWIFGGADIAPLLRALDSVLRMFQAGTDSATSMRSVVTLVVEKAIGLMLDLAIVVLRSYIALRSNETVWKGIVFLLRAAGIGVATIVGAFLAVAGAIIAVNAAGMALGSALVGSAIGSLLYLRDHLAWIPSKLKTVGAQMIRGLVTGIRETAGEIWDAMKSAVGGAIEKLESFLLIRSPSRRTRATGINTGRGVAVGWTDSTPEIVSAATYSARAAVDATENTFASGFGGSSGFAPSPSIPSFSFASTDNFGASEQSYRRDPKGDDDPKVEFNNCNFYGEQDENSMRAVMRKVLDKESFEAGVVTNG